VGGLSLAHNYLDDAEAYLVAARQLDDHPGHFSPKYFLLSHAVELALKAYVLAKGDAERETRKIRHDLDAALSRAVALGLTSSTELQNVVRLVAPPHRDYSFRYGNSSQTHILRRADNFEATVSALISDVSAALPEHPALLKIS
jgi:hypothetical protein